MSGSPSPVRDSSTTLLTEAAWNWSIPRFGPWDSHPMAPWSRFGSASPPANGGQIDIWAAPTLGGPSKPYLEGAAEFDWSHDGSRLAYHTAASGDPLFVSDGATHSQRTRSLPRPVGLHSHFPLWAPDDRFIYFVYGALPDKLDIWRMKPAGGPPERITSHNGHREPSGVAEPAYVDVLGQRSATAQDRGCTASTWSAAFLTGLLLVRTGTRRWPPRLTASAWWSHAQVQRAPSGECGSVMPPPSLCRRCESR